MSPNAVASSRVTRPARDRPVGGARHQCVDVALIGHVERAGSAGADRDAEDGGERQDRVDMARRDDEADQRGEDHQRHHPRLQERKVVADLGLGNPGQFDGVVIDNRQDGSRFFIAAARFRARAANSDSPLLHARQHFELVERRRRRQRPFQRGGAHTPGIVGRLLLAGESVDHAVDEDQDTKTRNVGAEGGAPGSSRRTRRDSRRSGAACRRVRGSAAGRTPD